MITWRDVATRIKDLEERATNIEHFLLARKKGEEYGITKAKSDEKENE